MLPILMKAVLTTAAATNATSNHSKNSIEGAEEADDSLLYAVVVGILYAFIMAFLVLANLHPSKSLLADLETYESPTDVNLNSQLPFDISSWFRPEYSYGDPDPKEASPERNGERIARHKPPEKSDGWASARKMKIN